MAHPTTNPDLIQYIYCVKLPFNCGPNSSFRSALNLENPRCITPRLSGRRNRSIYHPYGRPSTSRHPINALSLISMTWVDIINKPQWVVVKVGISKDPARRLHEIFDVFEELGVQKQMYLGDISQTDTPEVCIRKAKSLDSIVFIQKVQDIGTAEGDVRNCLGRSLGEDFIKRFTSHRGRSLNSDGMTEWIVAEYGLVVDLQGKFRFGQLYTRWRKNLSEQLTGQLRTPSGNEFFRQFFAHCLTYFASKGSARRQFEDRGEALMSHPSSYRPQSQNVIIKFEPTNFLYELNITQ